MTTHVSRRTFALGAAALATAGMTVRRARAADPIKLRVSLDTAPTHKRNVSIVDWGNKLEAASGNRIKVEVFHAGSLFKDLNVAKALVQGQVEMACPGTWTLTGFVPDFDFPSLPMLYGLPLEQVHKATDGKTGALVNSLLAKKLHLQILGPWLDLGAQHWFTTGKHPLHSFADLKGLKIRNAGGAALGVRTRFFDAIPNVTAWPDVPLALSQGTFDGLITTNESAFSAKLWDAGLKYSLQDHQNINLYVPLVSQQFMASLPADLSKLVVSLWHDNIATYRANMASSQVNALKELQTHGLEASFPKQAEIDALRAKMSADQDKMVKELKMDAGITGMIKADLGIA